MVWQGVCIMSQSSNEHVRFIRFPELQEILEGVSRSTIERAVAIGEFPHPFKLGSRMVAWKSSEVEEYLSSLKRIPAGSYKSHDRKIRRTK
jgi:prophage regulatory protein